ncbi:MAG: HupE/UreJ family protein [Armatimonadetes bacterium]|nr:HupE/UreJ family protein [Armatimonadota bacterium]
MKNINNLAIGLSPVHGVWINRAFPALLLTLLFLLPVGVFAHVIQVEPVAIVLRPQETFITAEFSGNVQDITQIPGSIVEPQERTGDTFTESARERIESYINEKLVIEQGGAILTGKLSDVRYDDNVDPAKAKFRMSLRYPRPESSQNPDAAKQPMRITSTLFSYLPNAIATVNVGGYQRNLRPGESTEVDPSDLAANLFTNIGNFMYLGMMHIFQGPDHLAFIFGLLIVAPNFRTLIKVLTGFTISHSVSLVLVSLGKIELPMLWIELFVYATIMYVGVENIWRKDFKHRIWYATAFGFIHGLAFGSNLREIGLPEGNALFWSLLSFNLGVEFAQVIVCAILFPLLMRWKADSEKRARHGAMRWETVTKAASLLIVAAGGYWMIEKLLTLLPAGKA